MADLNYKVRIDTTQAQASLNGLKASIGGLAAALGVGAFVSFADGITNIQNKLRTLSPNTADVVKQFNAIAQIANQSRAPLEAVGDLYFRIARASEQLGISQQEAATITDTLAKGLTSSGLSAAEAAGPLLQLGQALQSGRFQGDELRSVLEGMPIVAKALADEMNVPIGQLRRLGSEGKITGEVFVRAMANSRAAILDAFGRTVPTVGQSIERLRTNLAQLFVNVGGGEAVAGLANAVGDLATAMAPLGRFIKENGEGLATIIKVAAGVTVAYLALGRGMRAVGAIGNAIAAGFVAKTTILKALQSALLGVVFGFVNFGKNLLRAVGLMSTAYGGLASLAFAGTALLRVFARFAGIAGLFYAAAEAIDFLLKKLGVNFSILGSLGDAWDWLKTKIFGATEANNAAGAASDNAIGKLNTEVEGRKKAVAATAQQIIEINRLAEAYNLTAQGQERSLEISNQLIGLGDVQRNLVENLRTSYENYLNQRRTLEKEVIDASAKGTEEELARIPLLNRALQDLDARYQQNLETITKLTLEQERLTAARALEQFTITEAQRNADELIRIQREIEDLGLSGIEKGYRDIARAAEDSARAAIRAEEARRKAPLDPAEAEEYYRRAREGAEELVRQQGRLNEKARSFSTGWRRAFAEYADNATNAARTAENLFRKATQGMEDAIVNFAKTGKFEWRNFVNMMLEELLRAQIQALFAQILGTMQGTMRGGMGGGGGRQGGGGGGGSLLGSIVGGIGSLFGGGGNKSSSGGGGGFFGGIIDTIGGLFGGGKKAPSMIPGGGIGGGGGILASIGSGISSAIGGIGDLFSGFFANGGMIPQGRFGIVGERGPEFVGGPASVTPMTGTTVTYNINAVDAPSFQALLARDPSFIYALTEQGRKGYPGAR